MASKEFRFHYVKTPTGAISGQSVLTQTEDAINNLGDYMVEATGDATEALNKATEALNKARKVKKAYVGVGGKARPFFSAEAKLSYYGTVTPLSSARWSLTGTTVGGYALFGGGDDGGSSSSTVDAYTVDGGGVASYRSPRILI